jgi:hypothetical protein
MEHCPTTTGSNDLEITWSRVATVSHYQRGHDKSKEEKDHLFLFFTFVTIVSLSFWQKVPALSTSLKNC